ncbi:MAG: hypothetical protein WD696_10155 [Bryobacteraceae bacterium]
MRRLALLLVALAQVSGAPRFYDDDPIRAEPKPLQVDSALSRKISDYYDFFLNTLGHPGERHKKDHLIPAQGINTLGEVPDGPWYANRHYFKRMSVKELVAGPGNSTPPSMDGQWTVVAAKNEGITPGFTIVDAARRRYIVKFDPSRNPELATSADVISSKFFHALGYHVPENYIVHFPPDQLRIGEETMLTDRLGKQRRMTQRDVTEILLNVPRSSEGTYRAVASLYLPIKPIGPFRYHSTRSDDPNDIVPHEHRRDLRGLNVFCAWLAHDDSRAINTLDGLVTENGVQFVKHFLIDFGSTLGSASNGPNTPRSGPEYLFAWKPAIFQVFTMGLFVPEWARAKYPDIPSVGTFEADVFNAERWVAEYPNPAFSNRLPDDAFWGTRQVMAFTDEEIRAMVRTGEYSDPEAEKYVADCLIKRRDKIGRAFFSKVLPLDRFRVEDGRLAFDDLEVQHGFRESRTHTVQWSRYDNGSGEKTELPGQTTFTLPQPSPAADYLCAVIRGEDARKTVTAYLRVRGGKAEVVGLTRTW